MARQESAERAKQLTGGFATARKNITLQYQGRDLTEAYILNKVKRDLLSKGIEEEDLLSVDIYIKPEENSVYYVVNREVNGKVDL